MILCQLRLQVGEMVEVLERVNDKWWWVECGGEIGYAPSNHISESQPDTEKEDHWENDEYFGSYGHMVHTPSLSDDIIHVVLYLETSSGDVDRHLSHTGIQNSN